MKKNPENHYIYETKKPTDQNYYKNISFQEYNKI